MVTNDKNASTSIKRPKKSKAGMWVSLIIILAVLGGVGLWATTKMNTTVASTGGTYTVASGPLTITVTEGGSIRAQNSIKYKFRLRETGTYRI